MTTRLEEIMNRRVVTAAPEETANAAWTRMRRRNIRHLVVLHDGDVAGVLSERDLGGRTGAGSRRGQTVGTLMSSGVVSAPPETTVREAADLMRKGLIGALPVVEGDRLVGIVTATDVFDTLGAEAEPRLSQAERGMLRAPASSKRLGGSAPPRRRGEVETKRSARSTWNLTKRQPLADQLPKGDKATLGRTPAPLIPATIRAMGVEVDDETRTYIRRKLGMKLGKFAKSIERVTVRLRDVNGPRGGVDHRCQIKIVLSNQPSVVVEAEDAAPGPAIDRAIASAAGAVRRTLQRRRTTARGSTRPAAGT